MTYMQQSEGEMRVSHGDGALEFTFAPSEMCGLKLANATEYSHSPVSRCTASLASAVAFFRQEQKAVWRLSTEEWHYPPPWSAAPAVQQCSLLTTIPARPRRTRLMTNLKAPQSSTSTINGILFFNRHHPDLLITKQFFRSQDVRDAESCRLSITTRRASSQASSKRNSKLLGVWVSSASLSTTCDRAKREKANEGKSGAS